MTSATSTPSLPDSASSAITSAAASGLVLGVRDDLHAGDERRGVAEVDAEEPLRRRTTASASVAIEIVDVLLPMSASARAAALIRASVSCLSARISGTASSMKSASRTASSMDSAAVTRAAIRSAASSREQAAAGVVRGLVDDALPGCAPRALR